MNIPDQIHFDALDPDDFELQHWLATTESENLFWLRDGIAQQMKEKLRELVKLRIANPDVLYDTLHFENWRDRGNNLLKMIRVQLDARRPYCEMRAFKMEASHDTNVVLTSKSRWGRR